MKANSASQEGRSKCTPWGQEGPSRRYCRRKFGDDVDVRCSPLRYRVDVAHHLKHVQTHAITAQSKGKRHQPSIENVTRTTQTPIGLYHLCCIEHFSFFILVCLVFIKYLYLALDLYGIVFKYYSDPMFTLIYVEIQLVAQFVGGLPSKDV